MYFIRPLLLIRLPGHILLPLYLSFLLSLILAELLTQALKLGKDVCYVIFLFLKFVKLLLSLVLLSLIEFFLLNLDLYVM